jgi:hypothetical protein
LNFLDRFFKIDDEIKFHVYLSQTTNLQDNVETGMDLWNIAMGMRCTIKYRKNPELPVQTIKAYNKRTMVRYESNSSPRPPH